MPATKAAISSLCRLPIEALRKGSATVVPKGQRTLSEQILEYRRVLSTPTEALVAYEDMCSRVPHYSERSVYASQADRMV